jgi:hypothetical protein
MEVICGTSFAFLRFQEQDRPSAAYDSQGLFYAVILNPMESAMAKSKDREAFPSSDQPHRALLFEFKGQTVTEDGNTGTERTEMLAALSMEEVIAYMRRREPSVEIVGLKVLGRVLVLSSSEHLV